MKTLNGKHILFGLTGGIAAYKAAECVRLLRKNGAEVRVVMTESAKQFITPITLQALSGYPVRDSLFDTDAEAAMGHIELARWADVVCVAPASANMIAKLSHGLADDLLTTLCLATQAPLVIAPAMNQQMWTHAATQTNITTLCERGVMLLGPASGEQACGDVGLGRMVEACDIAEAIAERLIPGAQVLAGKKIILTAGPTREAIDPVRYISNHSSGKMGYALAIAARDAGAEVTLISGPVDIAAPEGVRVVAVITAEEMAQAVNDQIAQCDIFIATAAVSDYRPSEIHTQKIKKQQATLQLELTRNPDIVASVAQRGDAPFTVGFAAETNHVIDYARKKLIDKKCDMVIANQVNMTNSGFGSDNNTVTVITADQQQALPTMAKTALAKTLIATITEKYHAKYSTQNSRSTSRDGVSTTELCD